MKKNRVRLVCMILIIALCIPYVNVSITSNIAKAEAPLFSFENTSYGVKDANVVAKKLVLNSDDAEIIDINEPDLLAVKENISTTTVKLYLVGNKGIMHTFELSPEDEWINNLTSGYSDIRSIENICYHSADELSDKVDKYESNIPYEYEDSLKKVLNPETGKYDLLNVSSGKYYSYGYDDINSSSSYMDYDANFVPYRIGEYYGFLDKHGIKISDAKFKTTDYIQDGVLLCYTEKGGPGGDYSIVTADGKLDGSDLYETISVVDNARVLAVKAYDDSTQEKKIYLINTKTGEKELTDDIGKSQSWTWKLLTKEGAKDSGTAYSFIKCESTFDSTYNTACYKTYLTTTAGTIDLNTKLAGDYCDCISLGRNDKDIRREDNLVPENYVYVEAYSYVDGEVQYFYQGLVDCYGNKVYGTILPDDWNTKIIDFQGQYGIKSTYIGSGSDGDGTTYPRYKIQAIDSVGSVYYEDPDVRSGVWPVNDMPFKLKVIGDNFCFYLPYEKKYVLVNGKTKKVTELKDLTEYDNARLQFDETLKINGKQYVLFYDGEKTVLMNMDAEQGNVYSIDGSAEIIQVKENKEGKGLIYIRSTDKNDNNNTIILNEKLNIVFEDKAGEDDIFNSNNVEYITNGLVFMYGNDIYNYNGKLILSIKKESFGISKEGIFRVSSGSKTDDITKMNYAYCNLSGKLITEYKYRYCSDFYHNIACVYYKAEYDDMVGIIDTNGKLLVSIEGYTYNDEKDRFRDYSLATAGEGIILNDGNYYFYDFSKVNFPEKEDSSGSEDIDSDTIIPPTDSAIYSGGNKTNKAFSINNDIKLTVPEEIPLIGGGEVSFDLGNIPVQFERDDNDFKIGIGISDIGSLKKDGWFTFKKFVDTQKEEYKKGINSLLASKFGEASMGMKIKPTIGCFGYVEGTITSDGVQSVHGKAVLEIKEKASQEWQTVLVVVPIVVKFNGEVGIKTNISLWLDFDNSQVKFKGNYDLTLPKIKLSAGIGISHIADISVYGSANHNITLSSGEITSASLSGELGASAKLLFASYEKSILDGTLMYYTSLNKKSKATDFLKKNNEWNVNVDGTKATAWNTDMNSRRKNSSRNIFSSTTLQTDVYDNSCPQLLKTDAGIYVLSYIAAIKGRTTGNQYAAVYSVYNPATKSWSAPVVIDDDGTADFYLNSVVDGNNIYFAWSNLSDTLSDTDVKNLDVSKAASMTEIEVAKLELISGKITTSTVTNNSNADVMPALYADDKGVFLGWCENQSNNLLEMSGINAIHMGYIKDLNFSESSVKKVNNPVRAIAIGEVNHTVQTAYIENAQDNNYINAITEGGDSISIASTTDNITQVSYNTIRGSKTFLWYAQNSTTSCIYMNNGISTDVLVENIDLNSCYDILNEADRDIVVTSSTADDDDKDSKIVGYVIKDDTSDSIKLMEIAGKASDFSLVNYDDGYMLLYTTSTANIENDSVDVKSNLCVATISNEAKASIESVSYLDEDIVPKGESTATIEIENNGFENTDSNTSVVVYCDKTEVGRTELGKVSPGDSETVDVNIKLPEDMEQGAVLEVQVEKNNTVFDSVDSVVGLTDVELSVEKDGESAIVKASNKSAYATNAVLDIYDTNTDGSKLATYDLGIIDAGKDIEKIYDVSDYANADIESLIFVITTDVAELFDCNNTVSLYIGKDELKTLDHIKATKSVVDYKVGDKLSVNDLNIYAVYTDDSFTRVTNYTTNADSIDMSETGSKSLIITYEEVGIIRNVTIPITVTKKEEFPGTNNNNIVKKPGKVTGLTVKNKKKNKIIVSWNWKSNVSGFQIQYAQNKKFTKKKKSKTVGKRISQKTITKLAKGKTYYVRVRAYKKSSGKKLYGKWSKIKKIKIRK